MNNYNKPDWVDCC